MTEEIKFGTDGWRAIIAEHFTFANVERVAYAIGMYAKNEYSLTGAEAKNKPILIGYDTRFLAEKFAERCAQILASIGIYARVSTRDVPTPCIAYAVQKEPTAGAIQITASHNPPQYCGIKYIPPYGGPATPDITNSITSHLQDMPAPYEFERCAVERFDPKASYIEALKKLVDMEALAKSGFSVGYDALYSTSRGYLDQILKEAGIKVAVLHDWRDPLFGGGMPEPKPEYLKELIELVKKEKLDVGLATDGDADRFAVIDETGAFLTANQLLCLLTRHLVKNKKQKGAVVRTVCTTHLLDKLAKLYGLELFETPVGFKYVGEMMRAHDVLIGGEESGGVSVKGHIPEKDGILADLLVLEMIQYEGKPISQIWKDLVAEVGSDFFARRGDLHLAQRMQKALMEQLGEKPIAKLAGEDVVRVGRQDGLKLCIDDHTWVLIRPSGTEPVMRLHFEAPTADRVDRIFEDFHKQINAIISDLDKVHAGTKGAALSCSSLPEPGWD
ncbi:MAG TPA: phosphoglucomutase/phosphomannomutase family protein [Candidatus Obscuribacterales bacterium]